MGMGGAGSYRSFALCCIILHAVLWECARVLAPLLEAAPQSCPITRSEKRCEDAAHSHSFRENATGDSQVHPIFHECAYMNSISLRRCKSESVSRTSAARAL